MKKEAVDIASDGVIRFLIFIHPLLYRNLAAGSLAMVWRDEARKAIEKGLETFPGDRDLLALLKHLDDGPDYGKRNSSLPLTLFVRAPEHPQGLHRQKPRGHRRYFSADALHSPE